MGLLSCNLKQAGKGRAMQAKAAEKRKEGAGRREGGREGGRKGGRRYGTRRCTARLPFHISPSSSTLVSPTPEAHS
jgi:hypothetical protein